MNKFFYCAAAGFLALLVSCNNLLPQESSHAEKGRAIVSLSVNCNSAKTILPTAVSEEDITKVELLKDDEELATWAGLSALEGETVTIDFGTYTFTLNLYTTEEETERLVQTATLENVTISAETTALSFTTSFVETGNLSVTISLTSENDNKIGKIEAGLFTIASDGKTAVTNFDYTELDEFVDLQSVYSLSEVPNGSYYLKLRVYDIDNETILNTFMDVVKINGYKTKGEVEIDPNNLNSFTSRTSGNIQVDDGILNIIVNTPEKMYLNKCDITFGATTKVGDTVLTDSPDVTWNAQLFYGGNNVDGYGTTHISLSQATAESTDDDGNTTAAAPASLAIISRLEISGTYQLYVTAVYNGVTSSQTVDLYIPEAEYYEYDVSDKASIGTISSDMVNLIAPAEVKLSGELLDYSNVESESTVTSTTLSSIASAFSNAAGYLYVDMSGITVPSETQAFQLSALGSDSYLFSNSTIVSLVLPSSVNTIGASSFYLGSLQKITIPATVIYIQPGTFKECSNLYNFTVTGEASSDQSVVYSSIHDNLMLLQTFSKEAGATGDAGTVKTLFAVAQNEILDSENQGEAITSLDFSDSELSGITEIADYACYGNNYLTEITSFGDVATVGAYAFADCSSLSSISPVSETLISIGEHAFYECNNISSLAVNSAAVTIGDSALYIKSLTLGFDITADNYETVRTNIISKIYWVEMLVCNGSVYLADIANAYSVNSPYDSSCFKSCSSMLSKITFNESAVVGDGQFAAYGKLTAVTFTKGGTIGNYSFYNCSSLSLLDLSGVTSIGNHAFDNCSDLTGYTGTLGEGAIIGDSAFYALTSFTTYDLTNVICLDYAAFCNSKLSGTITIPSSVIALSDLCLYVNDGNSSNALTIDLSAITSGGTWYYIPYSTTSEGTTTYNTDTWKSWISGSPTADEITSAGGTAITATEASSVADQILAILNNVTWDDRKYLYKLVSE